MCVCVCACVQIFYRNDSLVAHVCDGSGEDFWCADHMPPGTLDDHRHYFHPPIETTGELEPVSVTTTQPVVWTTVLRPDGWPGRLGVPK